MSARDWFFICLSMLSACWGCGEPAAPERIYRHRAYGYTIVVPAAWTIKEERHGRLRIEATGPKDGNGQSPSIYIMVVDRPKNWSWPKDVDNLAEEFTNYRYFDRGIDERAGVTYSWVLFSCDEFNAKHKNLNCTISSGKKIIVVGCFADETCFSELEAAFRKCVLSIAPHANSED